MKRTAILLAAWLLLLVPTLLVGAIAFRLLNQTQSLIASSARLAAEDRARSIADTLALAVTEAQAGLQQRLAEMPDDPLPDLLVWKRSQPLVRNVFVMGPDGALRWPTPQQRSEEEAGFLSRFVNLLEGRADWTEAGSRDSSMDEATTASSANRRASLYEMAAQAPMPSASASADASLAAERAGWMPWYADNRLSLLGWRERPGGLRFGVEVEMMALLSRLVLVLPAPASPQEGVALMDDAGHVVYQRGGSEITAATPRVAAARIGPALPHWEVAIYTSGSSLLEAGRSGFRIVSGLLVGTFLAAILFGGTLLVWQAWRNLQEARRKTTFVSNVSHELKTPLTAIRMYAELLGENRVPDEGRRKQYLDVIIAESQRLTRLVNNVLDFSRMEQGRKTYSCEEMDLMPALHEILDAQMPRLQEAGITLERDIPAAPCRVRADRDALEQAVLNLIDNAIKYAGEGQWLRCALTREAGRCRLALEDRGPGVPPAHRERIFDMFHRVDDRLTARQPGCGLGLSIARQLVRDLGGDLTYRPMTQGACFEITLPCSPEGEA